MKLIQGDNLEVMKNIDDESIHLIATDPPFNTGKNFTGGGASFGDSWTWGDMPQHWVDGLRESKPALLCIIDGVRRMGDDSTAAYLAFMSVRLIEMHRVLRADGSIFLHCDPTASHYLKVLMDAIFGRKRFVNEIVWHYGGMAPSSRKQLRKKHDIIFWYSKSKDYAVSEQGSFYLKKFTVDELKKYQIHVDGRYFHSSPTHKRTPESVAKFEEEGLIYRTKDGNPYLMHFLEQNSDGDWVREVQRHDVWSDIPSALTKVERTGYPTQKPVRLLERIISMTTKPGDVVLDPFCGSGTTLIAAEKLGRQWVGIDIHTEVENTVKSRLKHEGMPQLTS